MVKQQVVKKMISIRTCVCMCVYMHTNTAGGCNRGKAVSHTAKALLPRGNCLANDVKDMSPQRHTNTHALNIMKHI